MAEWNDWPPHNKRGRPPRRKPYVDSGTGPRRRPRQPCMVVGPAVVAGPVTLAWLLWRWLR
jgi:hypothetical protein